MKDSLKNRFKAIHAISALEGEEIDIQLLSLAKMSESHAKKLLKRASETLGQIYQLAHGWESTCCKGQGADLIESAIKVYYGNNPKEQSLEGV